MLRNVNGRLLLPTIVKKEKACSHSKGPQIILFLVLRAQIRSCQRRSDFFPTFSNDSSTVHVQTYQRDTFNERFCVYLIYLSSSNLSPFFLFYAHSHIRISVYVYVYMCNSEWTSGSFLLHEYLF